MIFTPMYSLFFILLTGYFAKRLKIISQNQGIIFIDYVITFALPAMIFDKIYHIQLDSSLIYVIFLGAAANLIGTVIATYTAYKLKFSKVTVVCICLLSLFGNTTFVGIPLIQGFIGEEAINDVILYDQFVTGIPLAFLSPFILSYAGAQPSKMIQNVIKVMKFPPFIALVLGGICKIFPIPEFIFAPLKMLSASVTPVALFSIGIGLSFTCIKSAWKSSLLVLFGKMIIAPTVYILTIKIFSVQITQQWIVGAILCAVPPMVAASALIMKAQLDSNLAISSVALGVIFTFVTMPVLYLIMM